MTARRLAVLPALVVLALTGAYVLIYLARWEWHRALISGVLFVATEVALVGVVVVRRLGRLERAMATTGAAARPDPAERPAPGPARSDPHPDAVRRRLAEAAPPLGPRFAWLAPRPDRMGVFLPILLGAGVLASGAALVVEALARRTAGPVLEDRLAGRLWALAPPAGGLVGPPPSGAGAPAAATRRSRRRWGRAAAVALGLVAVSGVDALGDATQSRPDERLPDRHTSVLLALHGGDAAAEPARAARELWGACRHNVGRDLTEPVITALGAGRVELLLATDVGPRRRTRIRGCLEDATLDHVQAGVLGFTAVPVSSDG